MATGIVFEMGAQAKRAVKRYKNRVNSPLEAAPGLVLLEFKRSYGLGFVSPSGRIVTSFHVVVDEGEIIAHLHDGRSLPVQSVSAIDVKRDIAVLDIGSVDATPVRAGGERLVEEGAACFVFGMVPNEDRARWVEARIASIQVLGRSLTVYRIAGEVPPDASGSPLIGADGTTLGVVTVVESDEGVMVLAVPWRYVAPLIQQTAALPLNALAGRSKRPPKRQVPVHPVSMLAGSARLGLEATTQLLSGAIRTGAPAYNEGNVRRCYDVYTQAAKLLIDARADCPGVQEALRAGLTRAQALPDVDHQAWAMRDTFDGLLSVIEKYLQNEPPRAKKPFKPTLLN